MSWENSKAVTPLKRDFLKALEKNGYRVEDYFEEARQKDGGLDPAMVSLLLHSLRITELPDYLIKPLTLEALCAFVDDLKRRMALMAYPA